MNTKNDKFKFEDKGYDFPFYKNNPQLKTQDWIIVLSGIILSILYVLYVKKTIPSPFGEIVCLIIPLSTYLHISRGKIKYIARKLKKSDIKLITILLVITFITDMILGVILTLNHLNGIPSYTINQAGNILFWIGFPIEMLAEELIKLLPFLLVLYLVYTTTKNRKLAIIIATIITMIMFGLLHYPVYHSLIHVLLLQGLGSIFMILSYIKTKNMLPSYMIHFLIDFISIILGAMF